ncbi:MAG: glycosyltransferase family 2 protein [Microcoleus sp. SM1_3_4]|nr:glycosyltransferase family 2 protein [Microcoleus sp. SM1_3_4]
MFFSVVIATYNREQTLRETLADVIKQNYSDFEVLVIDQTRTHEATTQVYLEELANSGKIKWFRLDWASLPGARNYGARRAIGDIILFIDDDVQLPDGFLAAHANNYLEKPDVGCVAGRVFDRMKLEDSGGNCAIEYLPPEAMDAGIAWYFIDLVHTVQPQEVLSARGCNMSFRKQIFTEFKLSFDERFAGSAVREESDFCLRLRSIGFKIWYDPKACLVHLGEESGGCHDIGTRSIEYQVTFYHNHFLMALKNLTATQCLRFFAKLFDCHVLGNPPCNKGRSTVKIITRFSFYILGFWSAVNTLIKSLWNDGQIYTRQDEAGRKQSIVDS